MRLQATYNKKSDLVAVTWQINSLQQVSSFFAFYEFYITFKFFLRTFSWISQCSGNCQTGSVKFSWANIWRGGCGLVWTSLLPQYIYNSGANRFLLQENILSSFEDSYVKTTYYWLYWTWFLNFSHKLVPSLKSTLSSDIV